MSVTSTIRLAIVDDHRILLGALPEWIAGSAPEISVVAAVPSWPELLTHPAFPVDVVLLDLDLKDNLPVALKLGTLRNLRIPTVVMSTYAEPGLVRDALDSGAAGYVAKSEEADAIVEAIRLALDGGRYVSDELTSALAEGRDGRPKLSEQERKVMALYAAGHPMREVASQIGVGEETAKSYLKRVRDKYRGRGIELGTKVALRRQAIADHVLVDDETAPGR